MGLTITSIVPTPAHLSILGQSHLLCLLNNALNSQILI